jgi:hypothetical protein
MTYRKAYLAALSVPAALFAFGLFTPQAAQAFCSTQGLELIKNLNGSWQGIGAVTPIGGNPERVRCRVNYGTTGANSISQVVTCAGTDYKIEASSKVSCSGNRLEGVFEEKIGNNTGRVSGDISGDRLNIELDGPSFKGRFNVVFLSEQQHTVAITQFDPGLGRQMPVASMKLSR